MLSIPQSISAVHPVLLSIQWTSKIVLLLLPNIGMSCVSNFFPNRKAGLNNKRGILTISSKKTLSNRHSHPYIQKRFLAKPHFDCHLMISLLLQSLMRTLLITTRHLIIDAEDTALMLCNNKRKTNEYYECQQRIMINCMQVISIQNNKFKGTILPNINQTLLLFCTYHLYVIC